MVKAGFAALLALLLVGCADDLDRNAVKSAPLSTEDQIKRIESRTDMPADVKARIIAGMKAQEAAKKSPPKAPG